MRLLLYIVHFLSFLNKCLEWVKKRGELWHKAQCSDDFFLQSFNILKVSSIMNLYILGHYRQFEC